MFLRGEGVAVHFQGIKAVDGVDIELCPGEVKGLIGPNGAGKTTLMNALSGFVPLTRGDVWLGDKRITRWSPQQLAKAGIARTFQNVRLFPRMTVLENIEVAALGVGKTAGEARERACQVLDWLGMSERAKLMAEELSFGDEQRVGIGRALATKPRLLLLDEPAAGLNEAEGDQLLELISAIRDSEGCGILLIEHDMRLVMGVCDSVHVLDNGKTIAAGKSDDVQANPKVRSVYLGTGDPTATSLSGASAVEGAPPKTQGRRTADVSARGSGRTGATTVLKVEDLHVSYGNVPALKGVSLHVSDGEMVGVVGPNGAGKSTLLLSIAGALKPIVGGVQFCGNDIGSRQPEEIVRLGVALVPERRRIFANLTVEENLVVSTASKTRSCSEIKELDRVYDRFPVLAERRQSSGGSLSGGQQQQLAIARALLAKPKLLLVDEPSLGLAPLIVEQVFDALRTLREEGVSILLVEQNAVATIGMSDRVYLLRRGEIEHEGASGNDSERSLILDSYMERIGLEARAGARSQPL